MLIFAIVVGWVVFRKINISPLQLAIPYTAYPSLEGLWTKALFDLLPWSDI